MRRFIGVFITLMLSCSAAFSWAQDKPNGPVILKLSGDVPTLRNRQSLEYDLEMLKQLPAYEISTSNPWEEGVHRYVGFNPVDLLKQLESSANILRATAYNQYITEIPIEDFENGLAIIAYEKDGRPMSVRAKGPLMVVYSFDDHPNLRNEAYYGRSIWQIESLHAITRENGL